MSYDRHDARAAARGILEAIYLEARDAVGRGLKSTSLSPSSSRQVAADEGLGHDPGEGLLGVNGGQ